MLVIFDLNKTLIHKHPTLMLRPHTLELFNHLRNKGIKIGIWSFCNELNFKKIFNSLKQHNFKDFDFLKCSSIDSTKTDLNGFMYKKDLNFVAEEMKIKNDEIILIEDDENKCVLNQKRIIVKPFLRDSSDLEFKRIFQNF